MSQNDFSIANQLGIDFRADVNSAIQALASLSSGTAAPSTTYAYQLWYDTTNALLKIRNAANSAWLTIGNLVSTTKYEIYVNSSVKVTVDSSGRMGIGNASPAYTLDVTGNINFTGNLTQNGSTFTPTVAAISQGNTSVTVTDAGTGSIAVVVDAATIATINGTGIGILASPSYPLHVAGDINYTGVLRKSGAVASFVDRQSFTSNGTWTKPAFGTFAYIECWGAGGSGGRGAAAQPGGGGGGGGYNARMILLSSLGATETVTVGAGGGAKSSASTNGAAGGNTTFGSWLTAYGGGGGGTNASGGGGGAGGGAYAAGSSSTSATGGAAVAGGSGGGGNAGNPPGAGGDGGINGGGGGGGGDTLGQNTVGVGGRGMNGGGGGGGGAEATGGAAGGVSNAGGNGGAGGYDANNAVAGSVPGGGGGGSETGNSGAGGNGTCTVYVF